MENINVLYIDSDLDSQDLFRANFGHFYRVLVSSSIEEVNVILNTHEIHVIFADQKTILTPGGDIVEEMIKIFSRQLLIVLTSDAKNETKETIEGDIFLKYMMKPYKPGVLKQLIDASYYLHTLKLKEKQLHTDLVKTQNELNMLKMK